MRKARTSSASVRSSSRVSALRSDVEVMRSSIAICLSVRASNHQIGQVSKLLAEQVVFLQPIATLPCEGNGAIHCTIHTQQCRICALAQLRVTPSRLAERVGGGSNVEHVVHYLEREANVGTEASKRLHRGAGGTCCHAAHLCRRGHQCTCLRTVNPFQLFERICRNVFGNEVVQLSSNHTTGAGRLHQDGNDWRCARSAAVHAAHRARGGRGSDRDDRYASDDRRRDAARLVGGRTTAPHVVVIHAG